MTLVAFEGRALPLGELCLILAEHQTEEGHRAIEAYLFRSRGLPKLQAMRWRFIYGHINPDPGEVRHVHLTDVAKQWALAEIDSALIKWSEEGPTVRPLPTTPALEAKNRQRSIAEFPPSTDI